MKTNEYIKELERLIKQEESIIASPSSSKKEREDAEIVRERYNYHLRKANETN